MALTKKGQLTIVSGAPRGGFSGEVAFLKRDPLAERSLSVENILKGPGLASSFGYDIAVVDLNADGYRFQPVALSQLSPLPPEMRIVHFLSMI